MQLKRFTTTHPVIPDEQTVYITTVSQAEAAHLANSGEHLHLLGGRQNGKTSTLMTLSKMLEDAGHLCIHLNMVTYVHDASLLHALEEITLDIQDQIDFPPPQVTSSDIATYIKRLLQLIISQDQDPRRFFLFIDELDALLSYSPVEIADFLVGLRTFAVSDRSQRLTIITASVLELDGLSRLGLRTGRNQTTFGVVLKLNGFDTNLKTVEQLLAGFPSPYHSQLKPQLLKVLRWTNGHPQLTMTFCSNLLRLLEAGDSVARAYSKTLKNMADLSRGHLTAIKDQLISRKHEMPPILHAYEEIRRAELRKERKRISEPTSNHLYLETIGLVQRDANHIYRISNKLYRQVINDSWINDLLTQHFNVYQYRRRSQLQKPRAKIGMIFTGGTIGMRIEHDQAVFRMDWVRETVADDLERIGEMQFQFLDAKDGVNMHPNDWRKLFHTIEQMKAHIDAVIIAHGTDTLAFSACALAFAYGRQLELPIIFTGSQCTLDVVHGDARQNLVRSCRVAEKAIEARIHEVMICFDDQVYKATRTLKTHDQRFRGFASYTWPLMAQVAEEITFNPAALSKGEQPPHILDQGVSPQALFCDNILFINIIPGLKAATFGQILTKDVAIDGIILATPGAGNIPSKDQYNFLNFIAQAKDMGIPVLINSQVPIDPRVYLEYRAALEPVKAGAIFAGNMTPASALTKFSWAIALLKQRGLKGSELHHSLTELMAHNFIDEIDTEVHTSKDHLSLELWSEEPHAPTPASTKAQLKVCVIMTGGTIGMIYDGAQYQFNMDRIEKWVKPDLETMAQIEIVRYGPKDGIDMNHHDWLQLYKIVCKHRAQGFDAVVITHGTDTLAYTASALAFAFGASLDFPIVFTGAQATLDRPQGDTRNNIVRAVYTAVQACQSDQRIHEVMLVFNDQVLRACRSEKIHDQRFHGFASPAWPELARITDRFQINRNAIGHFSQESVSNTEVHFAEDILHINVSPGLKMAIYQQFLEFETALDGIILATPGAGNIPNEGDYNFHEFLRLAQARHIPVLITSQVPVSPPIDYSYQVASEPIEAYGAIYAGSMTQAAALTKFAFVIGQQLTTNSPNLTTEPLSKIKRIDKLMKTPFVGEVGELAAIK